MKKLTEDDKKFIDQVVEAGYTTKAKASYAVKMELDQFTLLWERWLLTKRINSND